MYDTVSDPEAQRRYELDKRIGSGGFGEVYLGRLLGRSGFTKVVAIKVLNGNRVDNPEIEQRLRDEARLLALLRHRAIVRVEDLVEIGGRWAVVMEYIEGSDLTALVRRGPLPPRVACGITQEVAGALKAAHTARDGQTGEPLEIVHRDIKPANLRITPAGEVKVLDFGIARSRFDAREALTRDLSFGSTGYMAPERLDGIDTPPSDIYALGAVLSECLTGARLGQLSIHPDQHAEALAALRASLDRAPATLVDLLLQMLAYERDQRPSADDVERSLRELMAELPGPWLQDWAPTVITRAEPRAYTPIAPAPHAAAAAAGESTRLVAPAPTLAPGDPTAALSSLAPPSSTRLPAPPSIATSALELELELDPPAVASPPADALVDVLVDALPLDTPPAFDMLETEYAPLPPARPLLRMALGGALALVFLLSGVGALAVIGLMLDDPPAAQSSTGDATADADDRSGGGKRRRKGGSGNRSD